MPPTLRTTLHPTRLPSLSNFSNFSSAFYFTRVVLQALPHPSALCFCCRRLLRLVFLHFLLRLPLPFSLLFLSSSSDYSGGEGGGGGGGRRCRIRLLSSYYRVHLLAIFLEAEWSLAGPLTLVTSELSPPLPGLPSPS